MKPAREPISPDRLCEAAEAALKASDEIARHTGGRRPSGRDLAGENLRPAYLPSFSAQEIGAACEFLMRLGFMDRFARPAA